MKLSDYFGIYKINKAKYWTLNGIWKLDEIEKEKSYFGIYKINNAKYWTLDGIWKVDEIEREKSTRNNNLILILFCLKICPSLFKNYNESCRNL